MKPLLFTLALLAFGNCVSAQDLKQVQSVLESKIVEAHRKVRLSDKAFEKLMKEQQALKEAIARADEDGIWTDKEKAAVQAKIDRAEKHYWKNRKNGEVK